GRLPVERRLRLLGDGGERRRVADCEIRERLAVELDACRVDAGDEAVVGEPVRPSRGVDPDDPELPERPLLRLPVAIGVDERVLDLLLRVAVVGVLEPPVPLRLLEHLAALLARMNRPLDAWHLLHPQELLDPRRVCRRDLVLLAEPAPTLRR